MILKIRVLKENTSITVSHPYPYQNLLNIVIIFTANLGYGLPSSFYILVETPKSYH